MSGRRTTDARQTTAARRAQELITRYDATGWTLSCSVTIQHEQSTTGSISIAACDRSGHRLESQVLVTLRWDGQPVGALQAAWCVRELVRAMHVALGGTLQEGG